MLGMRKKNFELDGSFNVKDKNRIQVHYPNSNHTIESFLVSFYR